MGSRNIPTNLATGFSLETLDRTKIPAPNAARLADAGSQHRSKRRRISKHEEESRKVGHFFEDAIPLARIEIDLVCQGILNCRVYLMSMQKFESSIDQSILATREPHVDESYPVVLRQDKDYTELSIFSRSRQKVAECELPQSLSARSKAILENAVAVSKPGKNSNVKADCLLGGRSDDSGYRKWCIRITILWRNSQSLEEARSNRQNDFLALLTEQTLEGTTGWSPRDFYDSLHVPGKHDLRADLLDLNQIRCQLYPFQKRAVQWLLDREGSDKDVKGFDSPEANDRLSFGFFEMEDINGRPCVISCLLGIATTDPNLVHPTSLKGGILAEEMGLGKTVEVLSLISLHQRRIESTALVGNRLRTSNSTLIITPPSILMQWETEINRLTSFSVTIYDGVRHFKETNDELVDSLTKYDIVLATYATLASEIHYSGSTPERNLRYEKKHARRQSPLVQIEWWRVILDEAQMVESGVSNAAKVACIIPRVNAWAVSGTPMKQDVKDLLGLLIFLRIQPYCNSRAVWDSLVKYYKHVLKQLISRIAIRHTKHMIKDELQLPPQKRVVITLPFQQIEEQHYSDLFRKMCEDCGFDQDGVPLSEAYDPESGVMVAKMQSWLLRLRQTCNHPEVGTQNKRALGRSQGPLRSVADVLKVMIDQNSSDVRAEERSFIMNRVRRGQIYEAADKPQDALDIWSAMLEMSTQIVEECRIDVAEDLQLKADETDEEHAGEGKVSRARLRLRGALELQHISQFFVGNAYFQIKDDKDLTAPDSERFQELENLETEAYDRAKVVRKEILAETLSKAEALMKSVQLTTMRKASNVPKFDLKYRGGLESRDILNGLEDLCLMINRQTEQLEAWRKKMAELLLGPLVDQDEEEIKGDEYELSTKQQEEVYVYMEALRAILTDVHDAITGQNNMLIEYEMKFALHKAREGSGHAPALVQELLGIRSQLKPDPSRGSIRGFLTDLRVLKGILTNREGYGSARTTAELAIVSDALQRLQSDTNLQSKIVATLEKELDLFRETMNARLEYYKQLQAVSDSLTPYSEEVNPDNLELKLQNNFNESARLQLRLDNLKGRSRYLAHLQTESTLEENVQRQCIICKEIMTVGVLTSCGHYYDNDCIRLWWGAHRTCPTCKKPLTKNDFHQISYKPLEVTMQEELHSSPSSPGTDAASGISKTSIYSGIKTETLNQIKSIDVKGSFGTKIDTIARHLLWIRENDPGAKSIVFSQFKDFLDLLGRAFAKFKISWTSIDSRGGIEKFKNDPGVECFFLHAKAHSSGLNLVNAGHVFLCEPLINTSLELQAIARVHRIGQQHETFVWMYLVENTVEKAIYDISVERRMAHMSKTTIGGETKEIDVSENRIDLANSLELQDAPFSKLLTKGSGGGEVVEKGDLWNCLFKSKPKMHAPLADEIEMEVSRSLGADAAEARRAEQVN